MSLELSISPHGHPSAHWEPGALGAPEDHAFDGLIEGFATGAGSGLLCLVTEHLTSTLSVSLGFARDFAKVYMVALCQHAPSDAHVDLPQIAPPAEPKLQRWVDEAPPMRGLEYLTAAVLTEWWSALDAHVREQIRSRPGGAQTFLNERNPAWQVVGRVALHLAENKRDPHYPFAFLATYASQLSGEGRVQHEPLNKAVVQYAGAKNRAVLLSLLSPIQRAADQSPFIKEIVDSGDIYRPLAWTPQQAYRFLSETPQLEECGLVVRVPNWWKAAKPPRPQVRVNIDTSNESQINAGTLLEFSVDLALDGEPLTDEEVQLLFGSEEGLVRLRGAWVEVDSEKIKEALEHWKEVERQTSEEGLTFFEGMRLISGAPFAGQSEVSIPDSTSSWAGVSPGPFLEQTLARLRHPENGKLSKPPGLKAELREYQRIGVTWLRYIVELGLGACLADDMGLGKTIQVIGLLLHLKADRTQRLPSLLVVPTSLIANWKEELARFAPSLAVKIMHPSDPDYAGEMDDPLEHDLVITSYGMLLRLPRLRDQAWNLVILDEAQAIKNAGTRQARAVKGLSSRTRIALTGTPVENRLGDLWSIFDFLNPGLLGSAKAFSQFIKRLNEDGRRSFGPLRQLVAPYILRRLKTDRRVIADLPEKTEMRAYCFLSRKQGALYERSVREFARLLESADGMKRRGMILAQLMHLKQICNHPCHFLGTGAFEIAESGKFQRLLQIGEELAARQEKALVFTQFREMTQPLSDALTKVFGEAGLILHGGVSVSRRRSLVEKFQRDEGPPFLVMTIKAGGTGLNLTAASHVIHFDRWWNPAVENQATDRIFRIGQKRNVFVHKFVCRGTIEEKIDEMIEAKQSLARDIVEGTESLLTEMTNDELLTLVSLDIKQVMDA